MSSTQGRTVLITGSTDGLGLATARALARRGARVLVHGRNPSKLERVLASLREPEADGPHGYLADLSSLDEVRRLARDVAAEHSRLDVLVNNAGLVALERRESRDGHELAFAVNHLSHFLLTLELLPLLERTGGTGGAGTARVVNVASIGQAPIDFSDVMLERRYEPMRSYAQSKLAQVMFTFELAARLGTAAPVTVNAIHPATLMDTNMVRRFGGRVLSTVAEGVDATVWLVTGDDVAGRSGAFFNGLDEARPDDQAYDTDARGRLWDLSEELTGTRLEGRDRRAG
jgi:NAD(P)-dependent dehydrogenase (short-subunit alcohol dehydrogenase family)